MTRRAAEVALTLGLGEAERGWLAELDGLGPAAVVLPGPAAAAEELAALGCPPEACDDASRTLPDPERDPERWWLLERALARLEMGLGDPEAERGSWPQLPPSLGLEGSCFYLHLFLAALPAARAWHAGHGVPAEVSAATFADLGRHVAIHRSVSGTTGVDEPWWLTLHLRALIFEIGRLQYVTLRLGGPEAPDPWLDATTAEALGEGFRPGDPALGVHIPAAGPLTPESCGASLARAREVLDVVAPVRTHRVATCESWLLDSQLGALLPPESNILAFQRRFRLVPGGRRGDRSVLTFVFRDEIGDFCDEIGDLDRLAQDTTLQRAVVTFLRAGGHFEIRSGWLELPEPRAAAASAAAEIPAGAVAAGRRVRWT